MKIEDLRSGSYMGQKMRFCFAMNVFFSISLDYYLSHFSHYIYFTLLCCYTVILPASLWLLTTSGRQ